MIYVNLDPGLKAQVRPYEETFSIFKFINEQLKSQGWPKSSVNGDSGTQI